MSLVRAPSPIPAADPLEDSTERRLWRHLGSLADRRAGYFAVHVQLSRIGTRSRTEGIKGVAAKPLHRVASHHDATVFTLGNLDVVLICCNTPVEVIDRALDEVRRVIPDTAFGDGDQALTPATLTVWYDLSEVDEFERLTALVAQIADARQRAVTAARLAAEGGGGRPAESRDLITLRREIGEVPVIDLIRRQTAIHVLPGSPPQPLFRESYISIADLRARINCEVDLLGTPWLFQALSDILDKRMIAIAQSGELFGDHVAVSLNLNQRSFAGRELRSLLNRCKARGQRLYCEIALADVLSDTAAFVRNRDLLRSDGHGIIIDGVLPTALRFLDTASLDADFVKVLWTGDEQDGLPVELSEPLREAVGQQGPARFILTRVDNETAVRWAAAIGIQRFQGYLIDRVVTAMRVKKLI